jgi:PEP-CTERM motif-containing protein
MNVRLFGVLAASVIVGTTPASAAIVDVIYTGTVTSDSDLTGVFGTVGGSNDLVGQTYIAKFVFDTSMGTEVNTSSQHYVSGGVGLGAPSPAISATLTIGSTTISVPTSWDAEIYTHDQTAFGFGEQNHVVIDYVNNAAVYSYRDLQAYVFGSSGTIPFSLDGPFSYTIAAGDSGYLSYSGSVYDYVTAQQIESLTINGDVSTLTVSSGVPEPSTWTMLMLGFAGVGWMAYRRKAKPALMALRV